MRTNFLLDEVLSKGQPKPQVSQEGSNLPVPQAGVDVVGAAKTVEQAESVEDLLPLEKSDEEVREENARLLAQLHGEDLVPGNNGDLLAPAVPTAQAVQQGVTEALAMEDFDLTDSILGSTAQPKTVTWDEMTQMVNEDKLEHAELQEEIGELRSLIDVSNQVDTVRTTAVSLEGDDPTSVKFLNLGLASLESFVGSPIPALEMRDGKVDPASIAALESWNGKLRDSLCQTFVQLNLA